MASGNWRGSRIDPAKALAGATGYVAMTQPRTLIQGTSLPGSQEFRGQLVYLEAGDLVSNLVLHPSVAAASLTLAKVGVYSKDGAQLAVSASVHAAFNGATGLIITPLVTPYLVPSSDAYYFAFLFVGTTPPTLMRHSITSGLATALPGQRTVTFFQPGQTDMPSTANVTGAPTSFAYWVGAT